MADSASVMPMVLGIDAIGAYDRNPRQERNPLHEEIKDSIRYQGLQQPLVVTRRPGEERYVVKAGGNTRLAVLRELYEETGEARFGRVHCLFEPWSTESDVLVAHLIENDTRGELSFIDKALAVRELKGLIESEIGEALTHADLAAALRDRGYRLERTILSRIDYAVDVLLPRIPEALRSGMGQPQIQSIRRLERAARRIWLVRELGPKAEFDEVFGALLSRYDGVEWQLDRFRTAVERELAERLSEELPRLRLEVDAVLAGLPPTVPPRVSEPSHEADGGWSEPQSGAQQSAAEPSPATSSSDGSTRMMSPLAGVDETTLSPAIEHPTVEVGSAPPAAKSLRARAWVLASRIAQRNALGDIVTPLRRAGAGFLVDFVYTSEADDAETKLARATLWWFLATVSEQFHGPPDAVASSIPEDWAGKPIAQILSDPGDALHAELLAEFALIDFGPLMGPLVFARIDERDWTDLLELLDAYRRLKRSAEPGGDLWPVAP